MERADMEQNTRTARAMFRLGPAPFLVPIAIFWAMISLLTSAEENQDWWRFLPLVMMLALVIIWHFALIILERPRLGFALYALIHIPVFCLVYELATILALRAPL
jgi:hypothetical protein